MHFVFPRLSTYLIIILIVDSSVLDPEVNTDVGQFFQSVVHISSTSELPLALNNFVSLESEFQR